MNLPRKLAHRLLDAADERRRIDERTSPGTKAALRSLYIDYRRLAEEGSWLPSSWETGLRVFSQFDEDGLILFGVAVAGEGTGLLVDLGSGDGVHASNSANLILNFGFHGLLVDADAQASAHAKRFYRQHPDSKERPPVTTEAFLTRDNLNQVIRQSGFEGEIDFLSIDVDGNDYWLWEALDSVSPRFVLAEVHPEHGPIDYVMPYQEDFVWSKAAPETRHGASTVAMLALAERLGYRLVGSNLYGFNLLFARSDVAPRLPPLTLEELVRRTSKGFPAVDPS
jgi:hypothetical protein